MELRTNEGWSLRSNWLWGAVLIVLGLAFMVGQSTPYNMDLVIPAIILTGIGITFYVVYNNNRERSWPLIPAYICWVIAGGLMLDAVFSYGGPLHVFYRLEDTIVGTYVTVVLSIPFVYAYTRTRKTWLLFFPAAMAAIAGGLILDDLIWCCGASRFLGRYSDSLIGTYVVFVLSVPFFYAYARTHKTWLLFFPAGMAAIGGGLILDDLIWCCGASSFLGRYDDSLIGSYVSLVLSAPFLYAYAKTRKAWLLIVPAIALATTGGILLDTMFPYADEIMGAYVAFVFALPFIYLYLEARHRWWALVTGGILLSIGAGLLVAGLMPLVPLAMMGFGLVLLLRQFVRNRGGRVPEAPPMSGPEADRPSV